MLKLLRLTFSFVKLFVSMEKQKVSQEKQLVSTRRDLSNGIFKCFTTLKNSGEIEQNR